MKFFDKANNNIWVIVAIVLYLLENKEILEIIIKAVKEMRSLLREIRKTMIALKELSKEKKKKKKKIRRKTRRKTRRNKNNSSKRQHNILCCLFFSLANLCAKCYTHFKHKKTVSCCLPFYK